MLAVDNKVRVQLKGFDYPEHRAVIHEVGGKYKFIVAAVNRFSDVCDTIEILSTKDCPSHLSRLVRTNLPNWRLHEDMPTRLVWVDEEDF